MIQEPYGPDGDSGTVPWHGGTRQEAEADHGGMVKQAGRDLYDIDVHPSVLSPAAAKAARAKPLVVPQRRVKRDRLRGRDELVDVLMTAIDRIRARQSPDNGQVWILHGMGGCGKTTVAIEVAHRARDAGIQTWWVSATVPAELEACMHAVAFDVGANEDELTRGHPADVLWRHLDSAVQPWLLVIDNADDLDLLEAGTGRLADGRGWLRSPASGAGLVLVTSREGAPWQWGAWTHLLPVPVLGEADGGQVLCDLAPQAGDSSKARSLCTWLGGLPLALDLAGSYLADAAASLWPQSCTPDSFDSYQAALEAQFDTLGADPSATYEERARRKLTTTWELSLDLLASRGLSLARPLLRLIACLAPAPVPYGALLDIDLLAASPLFSGATRDELVRALEGLVRLGLVTVTRTDAADANLARSALLPPLVRATNRIHPDVEAQSRQYQDLLISLLENAVVRRDPEDPKNWPLWNAIAPHCRSTLEFAHRPPELDAPERTVRLSQPAHQAAKYLQAAGLYSQAAAGHLEVALLRRRTLGESHRDTLTARHHFALALRDEGRWSEAHTEYREVLTLRNQVLGTMHPDTLTTRHGLASVLRRQGFLDQALAEYRSILALRSQILGDEHPDTLATRKDLAFALKVSEQDLAAETEYRSILDIQLRTIGENHPQTMSIRQNLATLLQSQGRLDEADAEYQIVLQLRRHELGEEHPDTLTTRHAAAYMLRICGHHAAAETEYRAVIALQRAVMGDDHPAVLGTRHNLAVVLQDQGRLEEAQAELAEVLTIRRRTLGDENPDTLDTRHAAAYLLRIRGHHAAAQKEYRAVIALQRAMVGDEHPTTLGTRHNLAVVLQDQGRLEEAQAEYAEVLAFRHRLLGPDHHDTVDTRCNLAIVQELRNNYARVPTPGPIKAGPMTGCTTRATRQEQPTGISVPSETT
jgi:tetratricopeptide (TPR) repeat protein